MKTKNGNSRRKAAPAHITHHAQIMKIEPLERGVG
jgi:hypothetical protein